MPRRKNHARQPHDTPITPAYEDMRNKDGTRMQEYPTDIELQFHKTGKSDWRSPASRAKYQLDRTYITKEHYRGSKQHEQNKRDAREQHRNGPTATGRDGVCPKDVGEL